jgi:hypothetical protein
MQADLQANGCWPKGRNQPLSELQGRMFGKGNFDETNH